MEIVQDKSRFMQLIEALQTGWEIEEPVLLGAMGSQVAGKNGTYHFILRKKAEDKTTLVSLPPSPQLLVFLAENSLDINALHA